MTLQTPWSAEALAGVPLPEYPRPQLVRGDWANLNGSWRYAITAFPDTDPLAVADPVAAPDAWDGQILVPFSPETPLSGVQRTLQPNETLWYRRTFLPPRELREGERMLLHFGAVDQSCRVAVDGHEVGGHTGGYLPFTLDVTDALAADAAGRGHELTVAVRDVTDQSWLSRGKQSTDRGGIWYSPQSGIWQTVWLEIVPPVAIDRVDLVPHLFSETIAVTVHSSRAEAGARATVTISAEGAEVARADVVVGVEASVPLPSPVRPWSPDDPFLYDVAVRLQDDSVTGYFGMRSFLRGQDERGVPRLFLNGEPHLAIGLLDQGYWPDGGYTAPSDAALEYDIRLAKDAGFDMLRKHIKVEPLRWYHHCDRLGMLVWQDAVNGGGAYSKLVVTAPAVTPLRLRDDRYRAFARGDQRGRASFEHELQEMIEHLRSVPSISLWVPFNEGWGQFDAARIAADVRRADPSRPVDHASGWHDQGAGDVRSLHIYFRPFRLRRARSRDRRAIVLSEYGGYSLAVDGHTWGDDVFGYKVLRTRAEFEKAFLRLQAEQIGAGLERGLSAVVYTQLSDVEDEINGLVTYDRQVVKLDLAAVRRTHDGLRAEFARVTSA